MVHRMSFLRESRFSPNRQRRTLGHGTWYRSFPSLLCKRISAPLLFVNVRLAAGFPASLASLKPSAVIMTRSMPFASEIQIEGSSAAVSIAKPEDGGVPIVTRARPLLSSRTNFSASTVRTGRRCAVRLVTATSRRIPAADLFMSRFWCSSRRTRSAREFISIAIRASEPASMCWILPCSRERGLICLSRERQSCRAGVTRRSACDEPLELDVTPRQEEVTSLGRACRGDNILL